MERTHFETLVAMYDRAPINKMVPAVFTHPRRRARGNRDDRPRGFLPRRWRDSRSGLLQSAGRRDIFAAQSLVTDCFLVTSSFQLYFLRPVSEGQLLARGQVVSRSKRLYLVEGVLLDSRGKEVARGSGTFMPSSIQLGPELGYELS
jgi:hypothetical protein